MRRLIRVERRHADQGEHVNRRQRLAGGRCDVPQAFRGSAGRRADDRRRRAIQSRGGIETNADLARPEAPLQSVDELLHPSDRRHHALPCTWRGPLRRAKQERCAQASRVAGVSALKGRTDEPPGGPEVPAHAHPIVRPSRAAEGTVSPARSPSRTVRRARSTPLRSMATAWVAGGRCNRARLNDRVEESIRSPRSRHTASTRAEFLIPIAAVSTGPCGVWSVAIRPPSRSVFSTISTGIPASDR